VLLHLPEVLSIAAGTVGAWLDALALPKASRVACVVPAPLARYLLVPWNADMQSRKGRQVFAEHCFRQVYDDLSRDWVVRVDPSAFGHGALACAIEAGLLDALERSTHERGLTLESVQPALMRAFNTLQPPLAEGGTWIVVPGTDALTLLLVENGRPLRVAVQAGSLDRLEAVLRREWFALGRDGAWPQVRVCSPPASAIPPAARA
jgi:hypothetical protein